MINFLVGWEWLASVWWFFCRIIFVYHWWTYMCVCGSELLLLHVKRIWDTWSPWMVTPLFYVLIWTPPLVLIYFLTAEIQTHNEGTARGNNCWFNISELFGIQWFDVSFFKVNQKADCNIFLVLVQIFNAFLGRNKNIYISSAKINWLS